MPAKGKYLLNCQELKNEALYRKFCCISQYQPLVLLLGLSMLACVILLILFFALELVSPDVASTNPTSRLRCWWKWRRQRLLSI